MPKERLSASQVLANVRRLIREEGDAMTPGQLARLHMGAGGLEDELRQSKKK
jgi:hypothetical protein